MRLRWNTSPGRDGLLLTARLTLSEVTGLAWQPGGNHKRKRGIPHPPEHPLVLGRKNYRLFAALVYWRSLLQCRYQYDSGLRHWHRLRENNGATTNFLAIQIFVGAVVNTKSGTCQRDACEESSSARIGKYFGPHGDIRFC